MACFFLRLSLAENKPYATSPHFPRHSSGPTSLQTNVSAQNKEQLFNLEMSCVEVPTDVLYEKKFRRAAPVSCTDADRNLRPSGFVCHVTFSRQRRADRLTTRPTAHYPSTRCGTEYTPAEKDSSATQSVNNSNGCSMRPFRPLQTKRKTTTVKSTHQINGRTN